jgi:hypothetical protein
MEAQFWSRRKLLEEEFEEIEATRNNFPPIITPSALRTATTEYYDFRLQYNFIDTHSRRDLCASCGGLLEEANLCDIGVDEPYIDRNLFQFDECNIREDVVKLCNGCEISLRKNKSPNSPPRITSILRCVKRTPPSWKV